MSYRDPMYSDDRPTRIEAEADERECAPIKIDPKIKAEISALFAEIYPPIEGEEIPF